MPVLLGATILLVALSRHFRMQPLCVLHMVGRDAGPSSAVLRYERPKSARRPFRLVLSARERSALVRVREAFRRGFRWAPAAVREPVGVRLAEAPRLVRS